MKIAAAYYCLVLYTFAICKPVLPLIQDELAHIFWKAKHLATVHHHHGEHHAEEEVAEAEHEENSAKLPATTKISELVSVHTVTETLYSVLPPTMTMQSFAVNFYNLSTVYLNKEYPPPRHF